MNEETLFIQGNDPRPNIDKPKTSYQKAYDAVIGDEKTMRILEVHVNDEPTSPVYYNGIPEMYNGGATYDESKANDYISQ